MRKTVYVLVYALITAGMLYSSTSINSLYRSRRRNHLSYDMLYNYGCYDCSNDNCKMCGVVHSVVCRDRAECQYTAVIKHSVSWVDERQVEVYEYVQQSVGETICTISALKQKRNRRDFLSKTM